MKHQRLLFIIDNDIVWPNTYIGCQPLYFWGKLKGMARYAGQFLAKPSAKACFALLFVFI